MFFRTAFLPVKNVITETEKYNQVAHGTGSQFSIINPDTFLMVACENRDLRLNFRTDESAKQWISKNKLFFLGLEL